MQDIVDMIRSRRCVRQYKQDAVSDEDVEFLIDCGIQAPSGFNAQPWKFLVIKDKEIQDKISEHGKKALIPMIEPMKDTSQKFADFLTFLKAEETSLFYGAPVLVIILGDENVMTVDYDCAMAAQTMMLAAKSKGIGSCWIGAATPALMDKDILKELGVPEGYKVVAPLIFGYPDGETEVPERNKTDIIWK